MTGADWASVVVPICASILGGGFAMAWRLGSLSNKVSDLDDRVDRVEGKIDSMSRTGGRRWTDPQPQR